MNARSSSPLPRPLLLLLLASALAVLGETLNSSALPASCPAKYSSTNGLFMTRSVRNRKTETTFYLHPKQGLKGIGLQSSKESKDYLAWIPLPETCFPDDTVVWWKMEVEAEWILDTDDRHNTLVFKSKTGMCNDVLCVQAVPYNASIETLVFYIQGPYGWREDKPDQEDCHTMEEMKGDLHVVNCTAPDLATIWALATTPAPASATTHAPATTPTPAPATTHAPAATPTPAPATIPPSPPASCAEAVVVGVAGVLVCAVLGLVILVLAVWAMLKLKQIDKQ